MRLFICTFLVTLILIFLSFICIDTFVVNIFHFDIYGRPEEHSIEETKVGGNIGISEELITEIINEINELWNKRKEK